MQDQEQELKLLITPEQANTLLATLPLQETRTQINTYYDTKDKALRQKLYALRLRQLPNGQTILTIKKPLNATTKYEYEREVQGKTLNDLNNDEKEWVTKFLY